MTTTTIPLRPFAALKFAILAALALVLLFLNACHWVGIEGNGKVVTDNRAAEDFSKIEADGAFTINWTKGPAKLAVTTDANLLDYIRTSFSEGKLHIEWVKPLKGTHGIKIDLASPALSHVELNGAVRLNVANLSGPEFYLVANGASRMTLAGNVNAMSGEMNGASRLDAEELSTRAMELSISGAGRADVTVSDALKVTVSGAGKVTYAGSPTVSKEISGAGSVRQRE
ncbi:MAG: DUF2807 domain-containing protein [Verrucomicrobiota bacterium]|nr:DUF2807 domain-containing protein [Verrucomicrobiota bacterium]